MSKDKMSFETKIKSEISPSHIALVAMVIDSENGFSQNDESTLLIGDKNGDLPMLPIKSTNVQELTKAIDVLAESVGIPSGRVWNKSRKAWVNYHGNWILACVYDTMMIDYDVERVWTISMNEGQLFYPFGPSEYGGETSKLSQCICRTLIAAGVMSRVQIITATLPRVESDGTPMTNISYFSVGVVVKTMLSHGLPNLIVKTFSDFSDAFDTPNFFVFDTHRLLGNLNCERMVTTLRAGSYDPFLQDLYCLHILTNDLNIRTVLNMIGFSVSYFNCYGWREFCKITQPTLHDRFRTMPMAYGAGIVKYVPELEFLISMASRSDTPRAMMENWCFSVVAEVMLTESRYFGLRAKAVSWSKRDRTLFEAYLRGRTRDPRFAGYMKNEWFQFSMGHFNWIWDDIMTLKALSQCPAVMPLCMDLLIFYDDLLFNLILNRLTSCAICPELRTPNRGIVIDLDYLGLTVDDMKTMRREMIPTIKFNLPPWAASRMPRDRVLDRKPRMFRFPTSAML
jgi:hypothetical protein